MMHKRIFGMGLTLALLGLAGCGEATKPATKSLPGAVQTNEAPKEKGKDTNKKDDHGHKHGSGGDHGAGPNGGVIFDLGKHHAEFTVDHGKKECYVLFIAGEDEKAKPLAVAATELSLTTKPTKTKDGKEVAAMTIKLLPSDAKEGKASKFIGSDAGLGNVADFEGAVTGEIGGKPSSGEFKE